MSPDSIHLVPVVEGVLPNSGIYVQNDSPRGDVGIFRVWFGYKVLGDQSPPIELLDEERSIELGRHQRVRLDTADRLRSVLLEAGADKALAGLTSDQYEPIYTVYFEPEVGSPPGIRDSWIRMKLGIGNLLDPDPATGPVIRVVEWEPGPPKGS